MHPPTPKPMKKIIRQTCIDFSDLGIPNEISGALGDAFFNHFGAQQENSIITHWNNIKVLARFIATKTELQYAHHLDSSFVSQYIEWLNSQCRSDGHPWTKQSKAAYYSTLKALLKWISVFRPGTLKPIDYPKNPFPWRNRDTSHRPKIPAEELHKILLACEKDIREIQARRKNLELETITNSMLRWLISETKNRFNGVIPEQHTLNGEENCKYLRALKELGGLKSVAPLLYPTAEALIPYYIAVLIQTAGNPEAISSLSTDCLQKVPLLEDRKTLVWRKGRANSLQRVTFSNTHSLKAPRLVEEIMEWSSCIRRFASANISNKLFIYKGMRAIAVLSNRHVANVLSQFCQKHQLPQFTLASLRGSVLASFYQSTGSLQKTKLLANHKSSSTTIAYVQSEEVDHFNKQKISALQSLLVNQSNTIDHSPPEQEIEDDHHHNGVSIFGFDCKNPYAGIAPGTKKGVLCSNFLGCFTCPNSVIPTDAKNLARLLKARAHLRESSKVIHPARWQALYEPTLVIIENDILSHITSSQIEEATKYLDDLPPLPELR